ncbi:hypothetical protein GTP46_21995 [Duganella sp. FT135W]|uniref:HTH luxR-type domain-containing protein n=1 Tax=Duganella flavida TaxID=2692175 RepID=A0A6L8KD27_9BURK|nr:LuxR family transcriptional regulator [Duganella flavida]MYM25306.1 hypothetical protein [Duganella flavida]
MEAQGSLLLALYRGARTMSAAAFPEFALDLLKSAGSEDAERGALQELLPHLQEALHINAQAAKDEASHGDLVVAYYDGAVQFCGPAFHALAQLEWPDWRGQQLPEELMAALAGQGASYAGRHLLVACTVRERWLYLRARKHFKFAQLSPRELEVARCYAGGLSSKEVAQQLGLAPATVRNFLQKVYQKLAVSDKAQLANAIAASEVAPDIGRKSHTITRFL